MKDGTHVINLDEYKSIGIHWMALYMNGDNEAQFYSFEVKYIPKDIKKPHSQRKYLNKYLQKTSK